jgi:hypothetical protein
MYSAAFKEYVLINPQGLVVSLIPSFAYITFLLIFGVFVYKTIHIPSRISSGLINLMRKTNVTFK